MFGRGPTTGSVTVAALAGVATGLLVAALLVAGREPQSRVREVSTTPSPTSTSRSVGPVTVTLPAIIPEPLTVTRTSTPAPRTVTRTVTPSTTSTVLPPTSTTGYRSD
ncbi:hypothetical protein ACFQ05_14150 [Amycolatopsis umgeniensis]|uniref:Carbohydrate-binding DOMON domain-containing protein n=1 Tax=Amycolatopsis umgeniensis TaxID=336628 RepID=A0A841B7H1_9PSEU|nr:hypothetical protein [Amycolatopsis umgeniensis]MBB5854444.1 carbohydrate-binding DOMON domain-containing protein [Amycolatopsis umgeniensis]